MVAGTLPMVLLQNQGARCQPPEVFRRRQRRRVQWPPVMSCRCPAKAPVTTNRQAMRSSSGQSTAATRMTAVDGAAGEQHRRHRQRRHLRAAPVWQTGRPEPRPRRCPWQSAVRQVPPAGRVVRVAGGHEFPPPENAHRAVNADKTDRRRRRADRDKAPEPKCPSWPMRMFWGLPMRVAAEPAFPAPARATR